jgi:hypothetical protein
VGLLEVAGADLGAGDLRGQGQHRCHAPVRVVQAVDQVQVAGAAAAGAGHEPTGQLGFPAGGERSRLLVPHLHPVDAVVAADGVHHRVEAVADHPLHPPHPGGEQDLDKLVGHGTLSHNDRHDAADSVERRQGSGDPVGRCHLPAAYHIATGPIRCHPAACLHHRGRPRARRRRGQPSRPARKVSAAASQPATTASPRAGTTPAPPPRAARWRSRRRLAASPGRTSPAIGGIAFLRQPVGESSTRVQT